MYRHVLLCAFGFLVLVQELLQLFIRSIDSDIGHTAMLRVPLGQARATQGHHVSANAVFLHIRNVSWHVDQPSPYLPSFALFAGKPGDLHTSHDHLLCLPCPQLHLALPLQ